jgi:hypothetical protein
VTFFPRAPKISLVRRALTAIFSGSAGARGPLLLLPLSPLFFFFFFYLRRGLPRAPCRDACGKPVSEERALAPSRALSRFHTRNEIHYDAARGSKMQKYFFVTAP